jgi:hypothetical protein
MPPRKGASNTQGRRARDTEGVEDAFMDDELAEQVDGLEIDDEEPLGGKAGRKGTSGAILSEQVRVKHALIPPSGVLNTVGSKEIERKAGALARLAMFTEYRRGILKREEIHKRGTHLRTRQSLELIPHTVMGGNSKAFPVVLEKANKHLRSVMGYEIVELMSRTEREQLLTRHGTKGKRAYPPSVVSISILSSSSSRSFFKNVHRPQYP